MAHICATFFNKRRARLITFPSFVRWQCLKARNVRELFSSNCGVSNLNKACCINELSRGSNLRYDIIRLEQVGELALNDFFFSGAHTTFRPTIHTIPRNYKGCSHWPPLPSPFSAARSAATVPPSPPTAIALLHRRHRRRCAADPVHRPPPPPILQQPGAAVVGLLCCPNTLQPWLRIGAWLRRLW